MKGHGMEENPCPINAKFFSTAHEILEHQKDLGLTEEQVKAIKYLKLGMKKQSVQQMADMQLFMLDIQSKLGEDTLDTDAVGAMIDQGFTNMTTTAKASVGSFAQLKDILTPEQVTKLKTVHETE